LPKFLSARRGRILVSVLVLAVLVLIYACRSTLLAWPGVVLLKTDPPAKADVVLVLAGGSTGERILEGGRLVRAGLAPVALVSGPMSWYESSECDAAIAMAVRHGYPRDSFQCVNHRALSTRTEAPILLSAARQRGARTVLVVTSDFHTRRARAIYHRLAGDLDVRVLSAPSRFYRLSEWYRDREARKIVFFEWSKSISEVFGM
jgi:uncharacterized SAM-binding protein YcdF (DUF218 family)